MRKIVINFICAFIPHRRTRRAVRTRMQNAKKFTITKYFYHCRMYYFYAVKNFGDLLALDLMRYFKVRFCTMPPNKNANFIAVGSHMESFVKHTPKTITKCPLRIWGTGFMMAPKSEVETFCRPVEIYALRGKLTLERCKKILNDELSHVVLGDPGLLIRRIFPDINTEKKYDVGIVCHFNDKNNQNLKNINLDKLSYCMIDIQQDTADFIQQVSQCKFILSSAMHGLICADSLNIPNRHIILSDKVTGNGYKFRDYYSVFKCPYCEPIDLRNAIITDLDIQRLTSEYKITSAEIDEICDGLIQTFPYTKETK